jgi:hypothetical protein
VPDIYAIGVDRHPPGKDPEAELALVRVERGWADITLDDGEVLTFHAEELRRALDGFPPLRAA